jgi:hypothetical protein
LLCEGLPDERGHAYLIKLHHALGDGLATAQLLEQLHTHTHTREPDPEVMPDPRPAARASGLEALLGQVCHDVTTVPHLLTAATTGVLDAAGDPGAWVCRATGYGQSLARTLSPPDAPASPLLTGRGAPWRFATLDVALPGLRAAAKAAGAILNDAFLAGLLGGYRRYHTGPGTPVEAIPMGVPISLRRGGDSGGGNRIVGARVSGPTALTDPGPGSRRSGRSFWPPAPSRRSTPSR